MIIHIETYNSQRSAFWLMLALQSYEMILNTAKEKVLVENCCGAKICEHNGLMERGPKWVKLNRLTISHSAVWI
jgi:hypothetical protein